MIFHVLELKLSQRYVGVDVWLWKVHPFQVNLQIRLIRLKQKNCLQNGILNGTWPHLLVCEAKTFKLDLAILLIHWKPELNICQLTPLLYSKDLLYTCKHYSILIRWKQCVHAGNTSWLPYSTYMYLDFHLLFHDKAKRTQQGNLLGTSWMAIREKIFKYFKAQKVIRLISIFFKSHWGRQL